MAHSFRTVEINEGKTSLNFHKKATTTTQRTFIHPNDFEKNIALKLVFWFCVLAELRQREFESKETEYMRKLERIYNRQLQIEDVRRKEEEKRVIIKEERCV